MEKSEQEASGNHAPNRCGSGSPQRGGALRSLASSGKACGWSYEAEGSVNFFRDSSVRVDDARGRLAPRVSQIQLLTGRMTMWRTVARAYYDPRPLFDREAGNIDLALAKYRSDHWDIPAYVRPSKRRRLPPVLNGMIHLIVGRRQLRLPFTAEPKESSARQCQDSHELEFEDLIAVAVRRFTKTSLWNDVRRFVSDTGARLAGRKAVRVFSFCIGRF